MSINNRIKQIRKAINLTQIRFAERLSISTGYVADLELGNKRVGERIIKHVSMEFGVDEHWLRTGEGSMFSGETNAKAIKALSLFKMLNPHFQDFVLNQLDALIDLQKSNS